MYINVPIAINVSAVKIIFFLLNLSAITPPRGWANTCIPTEQKYAIERKIGFEELGRRVLLVEDLMRKRNAIKNKIIEETGSGFKDIKINHCAE